ncbi:DUF5683 domain-containing protein [Flavobacterium seoulense]|uniref:DUF5683 domain-containing protein n=1 Tax=Flavobacterium seoulense TaxID=1492738 RepID=A0A066WKH2_9FLAO|nr:DUF5683 domain-containing protein [Flavobacterium seoulense]KDN54321.1 hypothetical protein FEM21_25720 [Flavobacterium seoulense]
MNKFISIALFLIILSNTAALAQKKAESDEVAQDTLKSIDIDPLTPAKAAFYSAVIPGLGQVYNKRYWKVPLVYGAIGTSLYFYLDSNKKYHQFRDEYKRRLEGKPSAEYDYLDDSRLISAQKFYQRNRDLSSLFVVGFYVLNIIDANVDAALMQFNVDDRLSIKPTIYQNNLNYKTNVGLNLSYNF